MFSIKYCYKQTKIVQNLRGYENTSETMQKQLQST